MFGANQKNVVVVAVVRVVVDAIAYVGTVRSLVKIVIVAVLLSSLSTSSSSLSSSSSQANAIEQFSHYAKLWRGVAMAELPKASVKWRNDERLLGLVVEFSSLRNFSDHFGQSKELKLVIKVMLG